jgi:SNF2 family DNA or RNA helicase
LNARKAKDKIPLFLSEFSAVLQLSPGQSSADPISSKHDEAMSDNASISAENTAVPTILAEGSDYAFSEVEESLPPQQVRTPHKKRKRLVKQSQEAMDSQRSGQRRMKQQELLQRRFDETLGASNRDPERQVVSFEEPEIYLHPHIGRRVKPHQLNGIQFMWRELIKDEKHQGCLLAHTMGLGKTMQV